MTTIAETVITPGPPPLGPGSQAYIAWTDGGGNQLTMGFDLVAKEEWSGGADVTDSPVEFGANVTDFVKVQNRHCELSIRATNQPLGANNWAAPTLTPLPLDLPFPNRPVGDPLIQVLMYLNPQPAAQALGTAVGSALAGAKGSLAGGLAADLLTPPGAVITVPVPTSAGQEPQLGPKTVTAKTLQFSPAAQDDFIAKTIGKLLELKAGGTLFEVIGTKQSCTNMVIDALSETRSSETGTASDIAIGFKEIRIVTTQAVAAPIPALPHATPPANGGQQNTTEADPADTESLLQAAWDYYAGGGA